jgi:hypothetical protein
MVSFMAFHERGLGVPPSHFMRTLLHYYKVELHHLAPTPSRRLPFLRWSARGTWGWSHTRICGSTSSGRSISLRRRGERGVWCAMHAGSCTLQVRLGQGEQYIPAQLISSNSG